MTATIRPCPSCQRGVHRRTHQAGYVWICRCGWVDARAVDTPGDTRETPIKVRVDDVAPGEERLIRRAASRYLMHKLRDRYPDLRWRHERVTLCGGSNGAWDIFALRPIQEVMV